MDRHKEHKWEQQHDISLDRIPRRCAICGMTLLKIPLKARATTG